MSKLMKMNIKTGLQSFVLVMTAAFLAVLPSTAQDLATVAEFRGCLADKATSGTPVIECVIDAHRPCDALLPDAAAAQTCYENAKVQWGDRLKALLDSFADRPAELQQVARIEAKYSVISNMLNCDMRMELALVEREPLAEDAFEKSQCEAVAAAASLTEVLFKSGTVTKN